MAHYLVQVGYTSEAWATLLKNPQNRLEAVRPAVEQMGGSIDGAWFAFGEHDVVMVLQMPDNTAAAAIAVAFAAGGALRSCKTTPLLSLEEGLEAVRRAAGSSYRPPSG